MLKPTDFFDLSTPFVSNLFGQDEYVWDVLKRLDELVASLTGGTQTILGEVMEGAYVSDRPIYIGEGARIEPGAYVHGPAYIAAGAVVRHGAFVRENAIVLERAIVGHATEIKNSILLPRAHAPHFNYVGDSILGSHVNLGAGTKLSNLTMVSEKDQETGKRPSIVIHIGGEAYDTGLAKLGAIMGDESQSGCNSVLNPGCLIGRRTLVYPNLSVRKGYYPADSVVKLRQNTKVIPQTVRIDSNAPQYIVSSAQHNLPNTFYLSLVTVDPASSVPLYRQIYQGIREAIRNGRLPAHTKLPSSRDLASIWGVSRNTLRNAFDQLIAEGYVEAVVGRGTFVVSQELVALPPEILKPDVRKRPLSRVGTVMEPFGRTSRQTGTAGSAFAVGVPDTASFPHTLWNRTINRSQRRLSQYITGYAGLFSLQALREAVASYLVSARGLVCTAEQIEIVPGSVAAMHILSLTLLNVGDKVWVEEPGYRSARALMLYRGAKLVPLPVDAQGINIGRGLATEPEAKLAYVTPSHQYPLGVTLSLARRQQLLDWAAGCGSWILEDDYDSEFRYDGPPLTALQGLDQQQRVIYCGSFSKVMQSNLRLGYIVLPPDLVDAYRGVMLPLGIQAPPLIQAAMADFMLEGHFVRHIRRMRQHYQAVRDALGQSVKKHLAGLLTLGDQSCGLHVVGYVADGDVEMDILRAARTLGLAFEPLAMNYFNTPTRSGVIIGYAHVRPEEVDGHIGRLAASLNL